MKKVNIFATNETKDSCGISKKLDRYLVKRIPLEIKITKEDKMEYVKSTEKDRIND
jgi:hypothetical protein